MSTTARKREPSNPLPAPTPHRPMSNRDWWPNQPNLQVLHQPSPRSSPAGEDFRYAEESKTLDVEALKRDVLWQRLAWVVHQCGRPRATRTLKHP